MRFRQARTAVGLLVPALVTFIGCASHTTRPPVMQVVRLQTPTRPANEIPSARLPIKPRPPELVPTTQIEPCVFRGSLLTSGDLYAQPTDGERIVELIGNDAILLERIELPTVRGGRAKVVVASPIQIEAYMDQNEKVLQIDKRIDVVPGHAWLDPRTLVHASFRYGETAEVSLRFSKGTSPLEFVKAVSCTDLSLRYKYFPKLQPIGDPIYLQAERISIHESAGGREVAAIPSGENFARVWVWPIETKPGWLHVEGNEEFHFNRFSLQNSTRNQLD